MNVSLISKTELRLQIHLLAKEKCWQIPMTELSAGEKLYSFRANRRILSTTALTPLFLMAFMLQSTIILQHQRQILPWSLAISFWQIQADTIKKVLQIPPVQLLWALTDMTKQKKYFTAVLRGMLNLGNAKFRYGCTGVNLDYLARGPLWEMGQDFNHGTGHGVGYLLNVHEGPNSFRWKLLPGDNAVLEEGMITSDEPGYYVENQYGIRHENLLVCKKAEKTSFDQFMCFEHLTMVPFDLDAVVPS